MTPAIPALRDGRPLEQAIGSVQGEERLRMILEATGLRPEDLIPNPTLDAKDPDFAKHFDLQRYMEDCRYALESFVYITTKDKRKIPFKFNITQLYWLFNRTGRDAINKARQHGTSTGILGYYLWDTMLHESVLTVICTHDREASEMMIGRIRSMYECFPANLRPKLKHDAADYIEFAGLDSAIVVQVIKKGAGRSRTCHNLLLSEAAFYDCEEGDILGLTEAVPLGTGAITIESSPNGVGNYHYKVCKSAEIGESNYKYFELKWFLNPEYDETWHQAKRREKHFFEGTDEGDRHWEQEYGCSFIQSQRCYFGRSLCKPKSKFRDRIETDPMGNPYPSWLWIFQEPAAGERYVLAADSASGSEDGDYDSATALSRKHHHEVACIHGRMDPEDYAICLNWLGRKFNYALLGVENEKYGIVVLRELALTHDYPNLFCYVDEMSAAANPQGTLGWPTNRKTRPVMLNAFKEALKDDSLLLAFKKREMEMEVFALNKEGKPTAPSGYKDDTIISGAIANRLLDYPDAMVDAETTLGITEYGS